MKTITLLRILLLFIMAQWFIVACSSPSEQVAVAAVERLDVPAQTVDENVVVEFTLKTITNNGGLAYIGIGGEIDGIVNPDLTVQPGDVVHMTLVNGDGMPHDLLLPDFDAKTSYVSKIGEQTEVIFQVGDMQPGTYVYYCTVPGHRQAGQEGKLIVSTP